MADGFCECGCGQLTNWSHNRWGERCRFVDGHAQRMRVQHHKTHNGYVAVRDPRERRTAKGDAFRPRYEHIVIVEQVLGHPLAAGAEVHHIDEDGTNNAHSNLVVCQDHAYHMILHRRLRALRACGNANYRKCCYCHQWDDPASMYLPRNHYGMRHRECENEYQRTRRKAALRG